MKETDGYGASGSMSPTRGGKPTPFDVWKARNKAINASPDAKKTTKKLSSSQWDKLADSLHQTNRVKQRYSNIFEHLLVII